MWIKELSDKTVAVGFFNRTDKTVKVDFAWRELGLGASPSVRDLWIRRGLGRQKNFVAELPAHGGALLRVQ
jgi:alpha-galactosidase